MAKSVILRIKKDNLSLIKEGTKKTEWRAPSAFNKRMLFKDRGDGKLDGNSKINQVTFINGYAKDAERLTVEITRIRMVKFSRNVEIPEDNFKANEGEFAIEITLGNIIS